MSTTSGVSRLHISIASAYSPVSPTTVNPGNESSNMRELFRERAWMSTSKMLVDEVGNFADSEEFMVYGLNFD
jgi:hypothetical protein